MRERKEFKGGEEEKGKRKGRRGWGETGKFIPR